MINPDSPDYLGYYAGFISRSLALAIDILITMFVIVGTTWFFSVTTSVFQLSATWDFLQERIPRLGEIFGMVINPISGSLVAVTFILLYHSIFIAMIGQTPGKLLLGVRVLTVNGERVPFLRAILRTVTYLFSILFFFLGFFWILLDDHRQAWHDKIAGTYVIYAWAARPDERFLADFLDRMQRVTRARSQNSK